MRMGDSLKKCKTHTIPEILWNRNMLSKDDAFTRFVIDDFVKCGSWTLFADETTRAPSASLVVVSKVVAVVVGIILTSFYTGYKIEIMKQL